MAALASGGPATATDLAGRLPITRQAIAKHLLAEAGLVTAEPGERRRVRYRLRSAPMQVAQQFLAAPATRTAPSARRKTSSTGTTARAGRQIGLFYLVCYLRDGDRVFETYWTTRRGVEAMDYGYALIDLTARGRQETWEDSPPGWPQQCTNTRTDAGPPDWPPVPEWPGGRPIAQWPRLQAGYSDDLGTASR